MILDNSLKKIIRYFIEHEQMSQPSGHGYGAGVDELVKKKLVVMIGGIGGCTCYSCGIARRMLGTEDFAVAVVDKFGPLEFTGTSLLDSMLDSMLQGVLSPVLERGLVTRTGNNMATVWRLAQRPVITPVHRPAFKEEFCHPFEEI